MEQENVGVEAGHKGEVLTERGLAYGKGKVRAAVHHHRTKPWRDAAKAEQASVKANADYLYQKALHDDPVLAASKAYASGMISLPEGMLQEGNTENEETEGYEDEA